MHNFSLFNRFLFLIFKRRKNLVLFVDLQHELYIHQKKKKGTYGLLFVFIIFALFIFQKKRGSLSKKKKKR